MTRMILQEESIVYPTYEALNLNLFFIRSAKLIEETERIGLLQNRAKIYFDQHL